MAWFVFVQVAATVILVVGIGYVLSRKDIE